MSQKNDLEKIFIYIEKNIPNNNILNGLLMVLRVIPLFLVTHDLNIHYKNSITYYISYYTLIPLIHKSNPQNISIIVVFFLFIYSILNIISFFKYFKELKEINKVSNPKFFRIIIQLMFWVNFIFAPYNFMFCTVNYFCPPIYEENESYKLIKKFNNNCRSTGNILIMIIQSILIIYLFIINLLFSSVISKPCCITSSLITTKLNEIKFKLAFFPFFQTILVLDYYLPLNISVIIKSIIRAFYIWYYISFILREVNNYFTNLTYRLTIIFIDSMCFFSCIIEYIALFDYKNKFDFLQENGTVVIFKLIIEITLSFVVIQLLNINEKKITLQVFEGKISNKYSYELLNKIFYIFSHPEKKFGTDLLYEIIENFDIIFKNHKIENKCIKYLGITCYCTNYTYNDFVKQSEKYLDIVKDIRIGIKYNHKILKKNFPIMYKYIENVIKLKLINNKINLNNESYLLVLALFYIIFDKNYNKGLFYLEEFSTTKLYQTNILIQFQCKLIKLVMLKNYENNLIHSETQNEINSENSYKGIFNIYSKISQIIIIENFLENTLDLYINSLEFCRDHDCSYYEFMKFMKEFHKILQKVNKTLINLFYGNIITSYHLCAKFSIFYSFFYFETPKKINKCFKNVLEISYKFENYSTIILKTIISNKSWKFNIQYASDNLCFNLGYILKELKNKEFHDLTPDSLKKCIDYNLLEKIKRGNNQIILKEVIFLNKENNTMLYNLIGIVVFDGNKLRLFFKIYPYNFQKFMLTNDIKKDNKKSYKLKNNNNREECYAFINKNGKIFAISKLFEEYFCLNLRTIKKYKVNLFKDILKIESIENKDLIKKNLAQVYENIAIINFNLMQNYSNEEFTKTYKKIKEIQKNVLKNLNSNLICMIEKREIPKNNREMKNYFFILFSIEMNNIFTIFEKILSVKNNKNQLLIFPSKIKIGEFLSNLSNNKKKELQKKFKINKKINEALIKIRQIQILSMKQLISNYNIRLNEILELNLKERQEFNAYNNIVENETNRLISFSSFHSNKSLNSSKNNQIESIDNLDKFFRNSIIKPFDKKKNKSEILKLYVHFLILIWILLSIIFIIFQITIVYFINKQYKKIETLTSILINSLMSRNILYSFVTTLLSMQYIANGLHNDTVIDNGFINTISFHKSRIYDRIKDFLYYNKQFERQEKYLCDYNEYKVINIFFEELDYLSVKADNLIIKNSLNSILSNLHLQAYEVIESEIEPFLFNISYYTIENRKLLGVSAFFQFVFDNYFCNGKYSWDEIDNLIYHSIETSTKKTLNIIIILSLLNGILICGFFLIQFFCFTKFNNQIYAKYYLNYNYLQFFNIFLLKKANLIKDFINNTNLENLYKFNQKKIRFENNIDDNNIFKNNYIRINNNLPIIIKPYKIIEDILPGQIKLGINKGNTLLMEYNKKETNNEKGINSNQNNNGISRKESTGNLKYSDLISKEKKYFSPRKIREKNNNKLKRNSIINTTVKDLLNETNKDNSLNILNQMNQMQTKKELIKPKQFLLYLIFFSISIISLTIAYILYDLILHKYFDKKIIFIFIIKGLIEMVTNGQEIVLIYGITILKGETMTFNYKSNGYLNAFKELDYINNLKQHDIIEELFSKISYSKANILTKINENYLDIPLLDYYLSGLKVNGSCEFYVNFYFENKGTYDFSFLNTFNYEISEIIQQCNNISYGINSQGITVATDSFIDAIIINYNEFKKDDNKSENLLKRANNNKLIGMLMEIEFIYDKNILNMIISWTLDTNKFQNKYLQNSYIMFSIILFLNCLIFIAYLIFFPIKTLKENYIISQVENCIYNNIMF